MALENEIIGLLKSEGFRITEAIRDALADFMQVVEEEADALEEDMPTDEDEDDFGDDD